MAELSTEQIIVGALLAIPPLESLEALREVSIGRIREILKCSAAEAITALDDFETRKLIESQITQGRELSDRQPVPRAKWFWGPSTNI
jgi:hypothetical protein